MATTPLATKADVEKRLRRSLTSDEAGPQEQWINGILEEATLLVTSYCGRSFEAPVPDEVRVVASRVAARGVTTSPVGVGTDELTADMGPFALTQRLSADAAAGGLWLSKSDKLILDPWCATGQVFSVDMA